MKRMFGLLLSLFCMVSVANGQQLFRDKLVVGDPYRDFSIVWSRGDPADPGSLGLIRAGDTGDLDSVTLRSADGTLYPTIKTPLREQTQWESWHWKAFRLTPQTPAGKYTALVAGRDRGSLVVIPKQQSSILRLPLGERQANYTLSPSTQLRGYGSFVTGDITVSPGCTIVGLTIDGNVTGSFDNCVFDSCTFRRGQIGPMMETDRGALFKDCRFESTTVATCSSGCFLRCVFDNKPATGYHNFVNERSTRLAVVDCIFRRTDRGLILRSTWGTNSENLYAGIQFNDINSTPNGGELICVEGGGAGFNRNLLFGFRQSGCTGSISLFDSIANNNIIDNCRVPIDIVGMAEQRGNIVRESELDYVRINWPKGDGSNYSGAVNTLLQNVACIGFKPSARGQASGDPKYYSAGLFRAVIEDGSPTPSTKGVGLTVKGQTEGFLPTKGITQ